MEPLTPEERADLPDIPGYDLVAELGRGGMGSVYLAVGPDRTLVALKLVHGYLLREEEFRYRFRHEVFNSRDTGGGAWTAAVVDADEEADRPWLASEFYFGTTLADALDTGPLDEDAVLRLAAGFARALRHVHGLGLVHRDVKPSNVVLTGSGLRIIDFGIARATDGRGDATLTHTGVFLGAPPYMSPEQIQGGDIGTSSDIFSLGATLTTAATGTNPFDSGNPYATMRNVVETEPDLADLPPRLRSVAAACLSKGPARRPTPAELIAMLGPYADEAIRWPESVTALTAAQRRDVAELLRARGLEAEERSDGRVVVRGVDGTGPGYRSGQVNAEEADWGSGFDAAEDEETVWFGPVSDGSTRKFGTEGGGGPASADHTTGSGPEGGGTATGGNTGGSSSPRPPTEPASGSGESPGPFRRGWIVLAVVVLVLVIVALVENGGEEGESPRGDDSTESEETFEDGFRGDSETEYEFEEPTESESPDAVAGADIGDCFEDHGDEFSTDIEPVACGGATFEVVDIIEGSSDLSACDDVEDADKVVASGSRALCLSYIPMAGDDAYHADPGECVYGPNESGTAWNTIDCQTGAFELLERLEGTSDTDDCSDSIYHTLSYTYRTGEPYLHAVLCLRMIYPNGDIGYAEQYDCLSVSGDATHFEFVSDCDYANAYVTGRTNEYDAGASWCGNDGWVTWASDDFPSHSYTVCWAWR